MDEWVVSVEGEVRKPRTFGIEELLKFPLEERVYRMRCVEGWSMVIPWVGFEFNRLAKLVEPTGNAKFVEFITAVQPETMPGVRIPVLDWPYVEGLRLDEALHPLTLLTVGLYGELLPKQNGAPVRIVILHSDVPEDAPPDEQDTLLQAAAILFSAPLPKRCQAFS